MSSQSWNSGSPVEDDDSAAVVVVAPPPLEVVPSPVVVDSCVVLTVVGSVGPRGPDFDINDRSAVCRDHGPRHRDPGLKRHHDVSHTVAAEFDLERAVAPIVPFGDDLELYECTAPMEVNVHADAKSFPESPAPGRAYFSELPNTLFVDASRGLLRYLLVHEATHQLLYTATELEADRSGDLPDWLNEGFAEYVAASTTQPPEPLLIEAGFPHNDYFTMHGRSDRPLSLSRTLALKNEDFIANSRSLEMYAQSYTLVHWCLHADAGAHREAMFAFLRDTFRGRSSPSRFKKELGLGRDFEEAWQRYALERAQ